MTVEERRARTAKGLCFNCDDTYSPGHRCKGKLFRMDAEMGGLIEMCEEPPKEGEIEDLSASVEGATEINLHALSGSFNSRSLRLK